MRIIEPSAEIITHNSISGIDICKHIEKCGRVCYKSEGKITDDSYISFIQKIIERGHEAVLEHYSITVKFVCDTCVYLKTGAKIIGLYAPAIILGGLSLTSIIASNNILKKRAAALAAA